MKLFVLIAALVSLCGGAAGQSPSSVLKKAEKAMGGKSIKDLDGLTLTGAITRASDGASGRYSLVSARPNSLNERYDIGGIETETGYNGRSAWRRNTSDGLKTLTGRDSVNAQARAIFRNSLWFNAKNDKAKLTSAGTAAVGATSAAVVLYTSAKGVNIRMFFDPATGLLLRDELPSGDGIDSCGYSDYRDVGGVKIPYARDCSIGGTEYRIRIDEAQVGRRADRAVFDFPVASNAPLPDVAALLKEVQENEDRVEAILDNYSFKQTSTTREIDSTGKLKETGSETVQLSFYKGYRIRRTIEKDGKPLSPSDQEKEDRDVQKQVEEIEKRIAKNASKNVNGPPERDDSRRVSIAEVLRASRLIQPRREKFRGRDCVVFDFEPDPSFDMKNAKTALKFFGKTAGVIWVDEKDKQVARVEAVLFDSYKVGGGVLAKINKGAAFTLENEHVNDEVWLPTYAEINLSVRVLLVKGINVNTVIRSYDYRRFSTEVKDATVTAPPQP
jgi:hypothetical protein